MTIPELLIILVVAVVGVPSATWNPTAAALVISWLAGEAVYFATGNNLPVEYYLYPDIFVLAVIMAKPEFCNLRPYKSVWHQLKCILFERSPEDRGVMLAFPVMWLVYGMAVDPYYKWWTLYVLVILQFFASALEAVRLANKSRDADADDPIGRSGPLLYVAGGWRGRRYVT